MFKRVLGGAILVLLAALHAEALPVINVGTFYVLPGTRTLPLSVSGTETDLIAGLNFAIQLGDGGVDNGGGNTTPTITDVDLTPLFLPGQTLPQLGMDYGNLVWMGDIVISAQASPVRANGTLARVTIDVAAGLPAVTKFDMRLKNVWQTVWGSDLYTDFATITGQSITPTTTNGSIVVLPNGHTMTWQAGAVNTWGTAANWSDSIASYPAGVTGPSLPDYTADVLVPGGTLTVDAAGPAREANSVVLKGGGTLVIDPGRTLTATQGVVVSDGASLRVNGSLATGAKTTIAAGAALSGAGTLDDVAVEPLGRILPGNSVGVLTLRGDLALASGALLDFDLDTPDASDLISMASSQLTFDGQQFSDFNFHAQGGFGLGTYVLIDAGAIQGSLGANRSGMVQDLPASISTRGNDLVLTVVPEPATLALLGAGLACVLARAWRRFCVASASRNDPRTPLIAERQRR